MGLIFLEEVEQDKKSSSLLEESRRKKRSDRFLKETSGQLKLTQMDSPTPCTCKQ